MARAAAVRPAVATFWIAVLALAQTSPRAASAQPEQQTIVTGQQLADAVAAYGRRNADTTLLVPANTTLRLANATFTSVPDAEAAGGKAFSSGVLTIEGAGSTSTVLDAGMRFGLLPLGTAALSGTLVLSNLSVVNNCVQVGTRGTGLTVLTQSLLGLFSITGVARTATLHGVRLYLRKAEVRVIMYVCQLQQNAWELVRQRYQRQLGTFTNFNLAVRRLGPDLLHAVSATPSGWAGTDIAVQSSHDLSDPLIQSMARDGTLMRPRFCIGQALVPPGDADNDYQPVWGPLLPAGEAGNVTGVLKWAADVAAQQEAAELPVPAVLITAPRTPLPEAALPAGLLLAGALQLLGGIGPEAEPPAPEPRALDLSGRTTPLFTLTGAGRLLVTQLTLEGLSSSPSGRGMALQLSSLASASGLSSANTSAGASWRETAPVQLHNVTLVLPQQDFVALLTLATDGSVRPCVDGAVLQLAAQLNGSISQVVLAPGQNLSSLWRAVQLSGYTGWGVNATQLVVRPQAAVPEGLVAACVPTASASSSSTDDGSSGGLSGGAIAGIVVGSVLGGALLLAAAVALLLRRRRGKRSKTCAAGPEGSAALDMAQPPAKADLQHHHRSSSGVIAVQLGATSVPRASTDGGGGAAAARLAAAYTSVGTGTGTGADVSAALEPLEVAACVVGAAAGAGGAVVGALQAAERRLVSTTAGLGDEAQNDGVAAPTPGSVLAQAHTRLLSGLVGQQRGAPLDVTAGSAHRAIGQQVGPNTALDLGMLLGGAGSDPLLQTRDSLHEPRDSLHPPRDSSSHPMARVRLAAENNSVLQEAAKAANQVVLVEVLGQGSSGTVYVGVWRGLPVAVKTMVYEAGSGDGGGELGHEAPVWETALSASLGHRNVVATYHYDIKRMDDQHQGQPHDAAAEGMRVSFRGAEDVGSHMAASRNAFKVYLVQELCQSSLREMLAKGTLHDPSMPASVNRVLTYLILLHVATGLEYLHGLNIIHGDLTPSNVLLKLDDSELAGMVAKLADFGLSRRLAPQATHVSNFLGGTPFYVAPEVLGHRRVSPAADVFSFGVIMWEMLSGQPPYVVGEDGSFRARPGLGTLGPEAGAPEPVLLLLWRCLQEEPRARPTATELRLALGAQMEAD